MTIKNMKKETKEIVISISGMLLIIGLACIPVLMAMHLSKSNAAPQPCIHTNCVVCMAQTNKPGVLYKVEVITNNTSVIQPMFIPELPPLPVITTETVTNTVAPAKVYTVTAYCACEKCCGKWAKFKKTADGHTPVEGTTCAASRSIPFGTVLNIEGIGLRTVQDRLATKYDSRIDIYFNDHNRALQFGKQKLKVSITN